MFLREGSVRYCSAIVSAVWLLGATAALGITVDELIDKNIQAKGGNERLRAVQVVQVNGKLLVNQGQFELAYQQIQKRPESVRIEAKLQGLTLIQAYDGSQAWQVSPFQGRKDPEKMSSDDAKSLVEAAEIGGSLYDYKAKGSKVEYLGTEDVDGTEAHKLKVTRKNGDVELVYLDPDYFLEIRTVSQRIERGVLVETETDLGDYEKVEGVLLPFAIESGPKNSSDKQKVLIDKAAINPSVDDSIFKFPATPGK